MPAAKKSKQTTPPAQTETHLSEVVGHLRQSLDQAHECIRQSLAHSETLIQHLSEVEFQQAPKSAETTSEADAQGEQSSPLDAVQQAVNSIGQHEQNLFGKLKSQAEHYLNNAEHNMPGSGEGQGGFLGQVSNALHGSAHIVEQDLSKMAESAQQHVLSAESAMKASLNNITQSIDNHKQILEQQFGMSEANQSEMPSDDNAKPDAGAQGNES